MARSNKDKVKVLSSNLFPVVGIGASAGGLDAFKKLLKAIPEDSGMAYILVQHLDPAHESILADLLQRVTKIPTDVGAGARALVKGVSGNIISRSGCV